jgi:signal peptide peptidase SppA
MIAMYPRSRFVNTPLALRADYGPVMLDIADGAEIMAAEASEAAFPAEGIGPRRPYDLQAGIAIIPIRGVLMHGASPWWAEATSYDSVAEHMRMALADADVQAIALHCDSPGGEVAGCFDLADAIYAIRGIKPIWAILDESAYSAAYALASAADYITVPRTGGTGSVGVIAMHVDISRMLEEAGVKISIIQYGERKAELYPMQPLSEGARNRLQADVDSMGEMFVSLVARNRNIDADQVRSTEAGLYLGGDGVTAGLADAVMSREEAFASLLASL